MRTGTVKGRINFKIRQFGWGAGFENLISMAHYLYTNTVPFGDGNVPTSNFFIQMQKTCFSGLTGKRTPIYFSPFQRTKVLVLNFRFLSFGGVTTLSLYQNILTRRSELKRDCDRKIAAFLYVYKIVGNEDVISLG